MLHLILWDTNNKRKEKPLMSIVKSVLRYFRPNKIMFSSNKQSLLVKQKYVALSSILFVCL